MAEAQLPYEPIMKLFDVCIMLILIGALLIARAALQVMYEITSTALMYFELVQTAGAIATLSFLI